MNELQTLFNNLNAICIRLDYAWTIEYFQRDGSYEGQIGRYGPDGFELAFAIPDVDYLDDLVPAMIEALIELDERSN